MIVACLASCACGVFSTRIAAQQRGPADEPDRHANAGAAAGSATDPGKGKPELDKDGQRPRGLHRPLRGITPIEALQFVMAGNQEHVAALQEPAWRRGVGQPPRRIERQRPARCGPWVAATLTATGIHTPTSVLLGCRQQDLLAMSSPGPAMRSDEIALLEEMAEHKELTLLVILVRKGDPFLRERQPAPDQPSSPAATAVQHHRLAALAHSRRTGLGLAACHGLLQAQILWRTSPLLRAYREAGRFEVAVGVIDEKTSAIDWVTHWHKRPMLVTSESVRR